MKRISILALVVLAACDKSSGGSSGAVPAAVRPAAVAGNDQEVVPSYSTDFATATGWTLDAAVGGVGWAVDGDPAGVPGGPVRSAAASLNYNDGTDYDNTAANSGAATSDELTIAGLASPALVFWCNYETDTPDIATDKRWLRISKDNFVGTVLNKQLATTGVTETPYVCAASGTWHRHVVPLDPAWQKIKVRFFFETVNGTSNTGGGWFLDDLSVSVQLSARGSSDPAGGALTYLWEQTGGTPVALSDPAAMEPTFLAPAVSGTAADNTLSFRLTVTGPSGQDTDDVVVQVKRFIVSAPDSWFVGYGKAGTLQAVITGTAAAPTYAWTGFEPWLAKSGEATDLLAYTIPSFSDLQNFPDRADVGVMQRTTQGRLQLTITATDGAETDADLVNFSAGPFADSVANENVTLGEPVFLNGSATIPPSTAVTSWTWSGIKPSGAAISFFKPDKTALAAATTERYVYFVPDLLGLYEIQVTLNIGPSQSVKFISLTCGKYVGVGNLTGTTPDPFKGECAACHAGQFGWLADFANPWKETGHAHMLERILDPANPLYAPSQAKGHWNDAFNYGSNYSIDSRTVGWSRINASSSGGWTEQAILEAFVMKGSTWDELVRKHPKTAGLSNVQCESCHGPGSEHAGDTTAIRKSFDANVCGRCHSRKQDLWEASGHGKPPIASPSGSGSCNNCHTAQGFVVDLRAQEGADPHVALLAVSNLNRPVIPAEDRRGTTCQACHEPHKRTAKRNTPAGQMDPQLRAWGDVQFLNSQVASAGEAAVCYMCHQSRTDTRDNSTYMNLRRGPHDSTAAEMLSATNGIHFAAWPGYLSSPHGIPSRFVSPGSGQNRQCLACHVDVQPPAGVPGYGAVGGHTFAVKQGTGLAAATELTHTTGTAVGGTNKFTVATGPSLLRTVFPGDTLALPAPNAGTWTVQSVDGARQLSLVGASFTANSPAAWTLTSVKKYNTLACTQCHPVAGLPAPFEMSARGDYDGDIAVSGPETIQQEVQGLLAALKTAIEAKLDDPEYTGVAATFEPGSRIRYRKTVANVTRTFPGPSVPSSENPDIAWASLDDAAKARWLALYQAAYNYAFVTNDHSEGIHNTGYAVNLLQSSYKEVTGVSIGVPFVPFP